MLYSDENKPLSPESALKHSGFRCCFRAWQSSLYSSSQTFFQM